MGPLRKALMHGVPNRDEVPSEMDPKDQFAKVTAGVCFFFTDTDTEGGW